MAIYVKKVLLVVVLFSNYHNNLVKSEADDFWNHWSLQDLNWDNCKDFIKNPKITKISFKNYSENNFLKQFIELIEDFESSNSTKRKTNQFLQAFVETKSGKLLKDILLKDSKIKNSDDFIFKLDQIWFRKSFKKIPFRHVFVGDENEKNLTGFHNWIAFNIFNSKRLLSDISVLKSNANPLICEVTFKKNNKRKNRSTILVGKDPAYELAVFTWCNFQKGNICNIQYGDGIMGEIFVHRRDSTLKTAYFSIKTVASRIEL